MLRLSASNAVSNDLVWDGFVGTDPGIRVKRCVVQHYPIVVSVHFSVWAPDRLCGDAPMGYGSTSKGKGLFLGRETLPR